jgi:hypothetical protein
LAGSITTGTLTQTAGSMIALSGGSQLLATQAVFAGVVSAMGGTMVMAAGAQLDGVWAASNGASIMAGSLTLSGASSAIVTDASSSIEIGALGLALAGGVMIDVGAVLNGQGAVNSTGQVIDNGSIVADGGTLVLGSVTGSGALIVAQGGDLVLAGSISASCAIGFTGTGTLTLAGAMPAGAIGHVGAGDSVIFGASLFAGELPVAASFVTLAADQGMLCLTGADGKTVAFLSLSDIDPLSQFMVNSGSGGVTLTVLAPGGGDGVMANGVTLSAGYWNSDSLIAAFAGYVQPWLQGVIGGKPSWVLSSPDGSNFGTSVGAYAYVAYVSDPVYDTNVYTKAGCVALVAGDTAAVHLVDTIGNEVLIGNIGNDSLVGAANGDTLIGGSAVSTTFWDTDACTIVGAGNDRIVTGAGNADIMTSRYGSTVFAVAADHTHDTIESNGNDMIVGSATGNSEDTIDAMANPLIFAPAAGILTLNALSGVPTVVGTTGTVYVNGSPDNGGLYFTGSGFFDYVGGAGTAVIVQQSGDLDYTGGTGAATIYGGSGEASIVGGSGNSVFEVGFGQSTVQAASGNSVFVLGNAACSVQGGGVGVKINAALSAANNTLAGGGGNETIYGGSGDDYFVAGSGNLTLNGGSGDDTIAVTSGLAGGGIVVLDAAVTDFMLDLQGYGLTAQNVVNDETVSGGNLSILLPDGTNMTLLGITSFGVNHIMVS